MLRLGFYWRKACEFAYDTYERRRRRDCFRGLAAAEIRGEAPLLPITKYQMVVAGGALAEATKPNVAVRSPFPPRWGWKGGRGDRGGKHTPPEKKPAYAVAKQRKPPDV